MMQHTCFYGISCCVRDILVQGGQNPNSSSVAVSLANTCHKKLQCHRHAVMEHLGCEMLHNVYSAEQCIERSTYQGTSAARSAWFQSRWSDTRPTIDNCFVCGKKCAEPNRCRKHNLAGHPGQYQRTRVHDYLAVSCSRRLDQTSHKLPIVRMVMLQYCMFVDYVRPSRSVRSFGTEGRKARFWVKINFEKLQFAFWWGQKMLSAFLALLALKSQVPEIPPSSEIWNCAIIKGEDIATFIGRTVLHILQDKLDYFPHFSLLSGGFIHLDYLFTHAVAS